MPDREDAHEYDRFHDLAQKLIDVPKREIDDERAKDDAEKREPKNG